MAWSKAVGNAVQFQELVPDLLLNYQLAKETTTSLASFFTVTVCPAHDICLFV